MYKVIVCYKCGRFLLARFGQKTRRCPYCNAQLSMEKVKAVAHARTAQEASRLIRVLKDKRNREETR